jgi:hypothetical protein
MVERLRIAFVDHDLDNFHANTFLALIRGELVARGAEVTACWAREGARGREWARSRRVPWIDDPTRLASEADAIAVLAPSNPELHWELCRAVLPLGLPTFVDKTFAPDLATARAIFALADRHGSPIQSSSALRYTDVRRAAAELDPVREIIAWGGGRSFDEYAVHPLELAVSVLGHEAVDVIRVDDPGRVQLLIAFSRGRSAAVNVHLGDRPFSARLVGADGERAVAVDGGRLFADATAGMLDFLASGKPHVDRRQTLAIRAILDAVAGADARDRLVPLPLGAAAPRPTVSVSA